MQKADRVQQLTSLLRGCLHSLSRRAAGNVLSLLLGLLMAGVPAPWQRHAAAAAATAAAWRTQSGAAAPGGALFPVPEPAGQQCPAWQP